jgi:hypothetical protein
MLSLGFPIWEFRDFFSGHLSRRIETDGGRLSPLASVLTIASISVVLWVVILALVMRLL